MSRITVISPLARIDRNRWPREFRIGTWSSQAAFVEIASAAGHDVTTVPVGFDDESAAREAISGADIVILAPVIAQGADEDHSGSDIAYRFVQLIRDTNPGSKIIGISTFLVGHDHSPPGDENNRGIWALASFEREIRARADTWTIVRQTWLSHGDPSDSYEAVLSQDPLDDGLVTPYDVARVVVAAIENPDHSTGKTFSVHNVPRSTEQNSLIEQLAELERDIEA